MSYVKEKVAFMCAVSSFADHAARSRFAVPGPGAGPSLSVTVRNMTRWGTRSDDG